MLTIEEYERAFELRLPIFAKVSCTTVSGAILPYSCIRAIKKEWWEKQGRAVVRLELLDRPGNSILNISPENCFLSMEDATGEVAAVDEEADNEKVLWEIRRHYEQTTGSFATRGMLERLEFHLREGMESEVIKRVIDYGAENNKTWNYISAVLMGKLKKGIKTVAAYERDEKQWKDKQASAKPSAAVKRSKFNNYVDTNNTHFPTTEEIIKDMLS